MNQTQLLQRIVDLLAKLDRRLYVVERIARDRNLYVNTETNEIEPPEPKSEAVELQT